MQEIANGILEFMNTIEKLCHVKRFTLMSDGRQETDSDHIMKLCFLAMMVSPYIQQTHSPLKLMELALVHDIVEADCGDTPYFSQLTSPEMEGIKKKKEHDAIEKYRTLLPSPLDQKIYNLFHEYELCETFESKIVHALDIFDGDLQCNKENFGSRYWKLGVDKRVQAMAEHKYGNALDEDIIRYIESALFKLSMKNKEKCERENL